LTPRDIDNLVLARYPMTFRNDCGMAYVGGQEAHILPHQHVKARLANGKIVFLSATDVIVIKPHRIHYGLFNGSGDRIGWRTITITPDMLDQQLAQFLSVEVKTLSDRMRDDQKKWATAVTRDGGRAEIWRETTKGIEIDVWKNA
jgi:hypothetical protein